MMIHGAGLASLLGWAALAFVSRNHPSPLGPFLLIQFGQWLLFIWMLHHTQKHPRPGIVWSLAGWAVAFRLCGFLAMPVLEDDYFRFLWDGWRMALWGNPYASAPADHFADDGVPESMQEVLDQINYPHVPTLYGPVCQFLFGLGGWLAPGRLWVWKLLVLLFDGALLGLAPKLAQWFVSRNGRETIDSAAVVRALLIVGWAPLMVFESSFNAHPDGVGVFFLALALVLSRRERWGSAGCALGLAAGAKLFALPLVPFVLHRSKRGWLAFAATLVAVYLPFWVQGSLADLSGLMTYGREWEFNSSLFGVAKWIFGSEWARWICAAGFAVLCLLLWGYREFSRSSARSLADAPSAMLILGALLLLSSTVNPWYLLWFAPFLARVHSATTLCAWALVSLSYVTGLNLGHPDLGNFEHPAWVRPLEYGGIAGMAVWEWCRRRARPIS